MSPVAIQGVDAQGVAVNGAQVKQALAAASEAVAKGVYDATTLSAVDADLAVGNIKNAITIFGKLGTFAGGTLVEDILGTGTPSVAVATSGTWGQRNLSIAAGDDLDVSLTQTYAATSLAVGFAVVFGAEETQNTLKLRLVMNGVQVAESAYLTYTKVGWTIASGTRALSGSIACISRIHNYDVGARNFSIFGLGGVNVDAGLNILVGSVKL